MCVVLNVFFGWSLGPRKKHEFLNARMCKLLLRRFPYNLWKAGFATSPWFQRSQDVLHVRLSFIQESRVSRIMRTRTKFQSRKETFDLMNADFVDRWFNRFEVLTWTYILPELLILECSVVNTDFDCQWRIKKYTKKGDRYLDLEIVVVEIFESQKEYISGLCIVSVDECQNRQGTGWFRIVSVSLTL